MTNLNKMLLGAFASVASLAAAISPAAAQTATTTGRMEVRLQVVGGCQFVGGTGGTPTMGTTPDASLSFGRINPETTGAVDGVVVSTGDGNALRVSCTTGITDLALSLDGGVNELAGVRRMAGPGAANFAEYGVFQDPGRAVPLAVGGSKAITLGEPGVAVPVFLYGRVSNAAGLVEGDYTDIVTMTLTY